VDDQNAATPVKSTPTISVVIPTFNGAKRIPNALSALAKQSNSDFEIVVVIDGSTDNTKEVVDKFISALVIKVIEQPNKGRAGARNTGARESSGELLVFMDDDMRPLNNWLEMHRSHHIKHQHTALVGCVKSDPKLSSTDFDRYMAYKSGEWMDVYAKVSNPMNHSNLFFTSANCSMPVSLFNRIKGFDESLCDAEDFELGHRILQHNIAVYFDSNCLAWHDDFPDLKKYIQRQRQYRSAWFNLIKVKPEIMEKNTRFIPVPPKGFKGFFFRIFGHSGWIHVANSRLFILFLPQILRFKLYDYIIVSLGKFNMHINID